MRHQTGIHDFERVFYIGIPLVFFSLVLLAVRHLGGYLLVGPASCQMSLVAGLAQRTAVHRAVLADFETLRPIMRGKLVFIASSRRAFLPLTGSFFSMDFYLSESTIGGQKYLPQNSR